MRTQVLQTHTRRGFLTAWGKKEWRSLDAKSIQPSWWFPAGDQMFRRWISVSWEGVREREEREYNKRLWAKWEWGGEKERRIRSMCEPLTTNWHSSSVVFCLHACFTVGALWVCLNTSKQPEKQSERKTATEGERALSWKDSGFLSRSLFLSFLPV